ncbi:MAG: ribosomal L7Ae/L30e/S12e/Gadd45 family protein [Oscillospiraceae bacterium]
MADRLLGALSLARKSGALVLGFDAVAAALAKGKVCGVWLASDLSPKTRGRIERLCGACPVHALPLAQRQVAAVAGKPVGVLALADKNLNALVLGSMPKEENTEMKR